MTTTDTTPTPRVPWRTALARTLDRDKLIAYLTRTGWDRRDEPGCAVFTKLADGEPDHPDNYYEAVVPLADTRDRNARLWEVLTTLDTAENRPITDIARDVMRGEGARYTVEPWGSENDGIAMRENGEAIGTIYGYGVAAYNRAQRIADALNASEAPQASEPAGEAASSWGWSKAPPSEPGWYWWRPRADREHCEVHEVQRDRETGVLYVSGFSSFAVMGGLWSQRIREPQAPVSTQPHCGHPVSAVYSGREGTAHCTECEREGREQALRDAVEASEPLRLKLGRVALDAYYPGNTFEHEDDEVCEQWCKVGEAVALALRAAPAQQPPATDADLDALLALARGMVEKAKLATPGEWELPGSHWISTPSGSPIVEAIDPLDASHIAACNPAAIQRLGELVERVAARCRQAQAQQPAQEAQKP